LYNVCYQSTKTKRSGSKFKKASLNGSKTKVVTVESPSSMLITEQFKDLFAVPVINELKKTSSDGLLSQEFGYLSKEDVGELQKYQTQSIHSHNEYVWTRSKGRCIQLKVCNFEDPSCEIPCDNIVIQHVDNKKIVGRSIACTIEINPKEPWERLGVTMSHCTNEVLPNTKIIDQESFCATIKQTYKEQGFGSRPSALTIGCNIYQGMLTD
jgi:hypothetical protein